MPLLEDLVRACGEVRFWRCADARAEALAVASDVERLLFREDVHPRQIAVMLAGDAAAAKALSKALGERGIPHRTEGSAAVLRRAEVRDVVAWMRILLDPHDAGAAARVLLRPPIEMRHVDLAQVVQIARRRRLDIVTALPASIESPQVPPEACERIRRFLSMYRAAAEAMQELPPRRFVDYLLQNVGLNKGNPLDAQLQTADREASLAWLIDFASSFERRFPWSGASELAKQLISSEAGEEDGLEAHRANDSEFDADAVQILGLRTLPPGVTHTYILGGGIDRLPAEEAATVEQLRQALGAEWEEPQARPASTEELIEAALRTMRQELLDGVSSIGGRLGELRLDTDVDVSHGIVRYLELVKLAALLERPEGQGIEEALADVNNRLLAAVTPLQREILESSTLDEELLAGRTGRSQPGSGVVRGTAGEPPLRRFLPRKGEGLLLSASDIETYRGCPLRYKFARVLRLPADQTRNQRFGIALHQVLERYHVAGGGELSTLLELLDVCWRRGGFGDGPDDRRLREKASDALRRYHERLADEQSTPLWFERSFAFKLDRHYVRGRVDRVDRLPDGSHELIDYKTGRPRTQEQLRQDIQLALYALAAQESWQLESSQQAYYYLLDDLKVPLPQDGPGPEWVRDTVLEVGESIMQERFDPTPSPAACRLCDYRIACPVAEG
ncbi:MAG TPA: PD-(D/E)XK nuclease family protein [Solirubrobacteraceae bacterium]